MDDALAVAAHGVTKRFGEVVAVDDISIEVAAGEVYGVLGPNGAGKTTFLRMVFGLIRADRGQIEIFGRTWQRDGVRTLDGVAGFIESPRFYPYLSGVRTSEHSRCSTAVELSTGPTKRWTSSAWPIAPTARWAATPTG